MMSSTNWRDRHAALHDRARSAAVDGQAPLRSRNATVLTADDPWDQRTERAIAPARREGGDDVWIDHALLCHVLNVHDW